MANSPGLPVDESGMNLDLDKAPSHKRSDVVTLEPYSFSSGRNPRRLGNRFDKSHIEIGPGIFEPNHYAKFLVVKSLNGKKMQDCDMFEVYRNIKSKCEKEPKISYLSDGGLLVEVSSQEESNEIITITHLAGTEVECSPHKKLNQVRGVIRSNELSRYSEEKIQIELESQGVTEVKQMKKTVGGVVTPLPTFVLTFDRIKLPSTIHAAWLKLAVRPYIPSVRRCFFCQKFGHVSNSCRRKLKGENAICDNCGEEVHGSCNIQPHCVNCGDVHPASSKNCMKYKFEQEVQALKVKEHLSFREARQRVISSFVRPDASFSSVLSRKPSVKTAPVNKPNIPKSNNLHPSQSNSKDQHSVSKTKTVASKRRLSDDDDSLSPVHSKNKYDVLADEMDTEAPSTSKPKILNNDDTSSVSACGGNQVETSIPACISKQAGPSVSSCSEVQDETPIPTCSSEQDGKQNLTSQNEVKSSVASVEKPLGEISTDRKPVKDVKDNGAKPKRTPNKTQNVQTSGIRKLTFSNISKKVSDHLNRNKEREMQPKH